MAVKNYNVHVSFNGQEIQNVNLQNLGAQPAGATSGRIYFFNGSPYVYNGTAHRPLDAALLTDGSIQNSALQTNPLARANHTGSQAFSTISDGASVVQGYRLSQFAVPNAAVPFGGQKITGLGTPTAPGDGAEYSWVIGQIQSAAAGIASKPPVRLVLTSNDTLSGLAARDGVTPVAGDRILATNQTTGTQNGVYNAAAGAWTRTTIEGAAPGELEAGALWLATEGTSGAGTQWRMTTTGSITVGSTTIAIVQFGATTAYTAGNGILLAGSSFAVNPAAGGGILVAAGGVSVDPAVVMRKAAGLTFGDGSATSFTYTHNLNTQDINVVVRLVSTQEAVEVFWAATTVNTATITVNTAPAANTLRATAFG